jgi:hypothetical protein
MLLAVFTIIFGLAAVLFGYTTINLLRKVERYEDFCESMLQESRFILNEIKSIDVRGSFESDDEVGIIYRGIKTMVNRLSSFVPEETE